MGRKRSDLFSPHLKKQGLVPFAGRETRCDDKGFREVQLDLFIPSTI